MEAARPGDTLPEIWSPRSAAIVDVTPPMGAESLFDGNVTTGFNVDKGGKAAVRVELGSARQLVALGVHGTGRGTMAIFAEDAHGSRSLISNSHDVALALEAERWAQVALPRPTSAAALVVEWTGSHAAPSTVTELALWVTGRSRESLSEAATVDRLVTEVPENAVSAGATPWSAKVARVTSSGPVSASFNVKLDRAPVLTRSFLVYELDNKAHWTAAARSINGHVFRGGYRAEASGLGGVQVEEINSAWLRAGDNTVSFQPTPAEDARGYSIKNVRVVSVPRGVEAAPARDSRSPLADGELSGGLGGPGIHSASLSVPAGREPAFFSFYLDKPTNGTLTVSADGGRTRRKGQVSIDLAGRPAGWQSVPVAGVLPNASELRVRMQGDRETTAHVSEARVQSFPSLASPADLTVAYPLHGECNDHKTYVRGFVSGTGNVQKPQLFVDGQPMKGDIDADGSFEAHVQEPATSRGEPWSIRVEVTGQDGVLRTRTVPIDTCLDPPKGRVLGVSPPVEDVGAPYGAVVSAEKSSTLSFAGAKIEIPAGAVDSDVRVTMRALDHEKVPAVQAEMDNVSNTGGALRFGPHGLKFKKPITITLPIEGSRMPAGMDAGDVFAFFFDEATAQWTQLPKFSVRSDRVVAETTHFTDFIAATIRTPDHPDMQQFNPNTMKGVKVGEPAAGMSLIQPPEANSNGSARLSYPIETPAGRNGIGPKLALTYDSDRVNGNGWLGLGWDLRMSSIEIDTRFGVPRYDGTETYLLDGAQLTTTGTAGTYVRRIEGPYDLIKRSGTGASGYSWTVTDKAGTIYTYGTVANSRLANPRAGQTANIFRWYLEKVQDVFGNNMKITYAHDAYTTTSPQTENYDGVYLQAIDYTANATTSLAANYHVTFTLDAAGTRPDSLINGRPGFLESTRQRLTDVIVKSGTTLVRQYHFDYVTSLADTLQKTVLADVAVWGVQGTASSELYRHTFEYQKAPAATDMFSAPALWGQVWQHQAPPGNGSVTRLANGLAHSADNLIGGSVTLGVGFPSITATGSFGADTGSSTPDLAFFGVTGEGLADQVDIQGYGSRTLLVGTQPNDQIVPWNASGLTQLGATGRTGFTAGGNVSVLQGLFGAGAAYSRHISQDTGIITDINGDGFPDVAYQNGGNVTAYVNDGNHNFTAKQWTGYSLASSPFSTAARMNDSAIASESFRVDPLIRWVAPFSGTVTINSSIARPVADAVRADLYVANDAVRSVTTQSSQAIVSNYVRAVNAGDKIYMRVVGLAKDASNDFVDYRTSVNYTPPSGRTASEVDPTGFPIFNYSSYNDFLVQGQPHLPWHLAGAGDVGVARCFVGAALDDVTVSWVLKFKNGTLDRQRNLTVPAGQSACFDSTLPVSGNDSNMGMFTSVQEDETLSLEVSSDTPVGQYLPTATTMPANGHFASYTSYCRSNNCGPPQATGSGYSVAGDPYGTMFPIPASDIFHDWPFGYTQTRVWKTYNNGITTSPQPIRSLPAPSTSVTFGGTVRTTAALTEDVFLLIQGVNRRFTKFKIPKGTAANTTLSVPAGPFTVASQAPLFFTVYSPTVIGGNVAWSPTINSVALTTTQLNSVNKSIRDATFDNNPPAGDNSRDPMSGGFHNWFYGDWNDSIAFCDNTSGCANPIVRTTATFQNTDAVMGEVPSPVQPVPGMAWAGRGGAEMTTAEEAFAMIPGQVFPPSATATDGSSMSALRVADTWNVNLTASVAGLSGGVNGGDSTTQVDFFDMNGDRYPDSITLGGVQYNDGTSSFGTRKGLDFSIDDRTEIRQILNAAMEGGVSIPVNASDSRQLINEVDGGGKTKKLSATASLGASADYGVSSTRIDFVDVNGDGLPDHVRQEPGDTMLRVRLNLGYGFSNEIAWTTSTPSSNWSWGTTDVAPIVSQLGSWQNLVAAVGTGGLSLVVSLLNKLLGTPSSTNVVRLQDTGTDGATVAVGLGPVGGGGGPSFSVTRTLVDMIDVNGDGLADQVLKVPGDQHLYVKLNTGTGFTPQQQWNLPDWSTSTGTTFSFLPPDGLGFSTVNGWGKNLSFQFCFVVCVGASGFESDSDGGPTAQFEDIDGDGKVDQVMKVPGDSAVYAKLNNIGQTNLLLAVNRPLGGRIEIGYTRSGNYVDLTGQPINMPANQWAMSSVTVHSEYSSRLDASIQETFDYTNPSGYPNGYSDPVERENLGYGTVKTRYPYEDVGGTSVARSYFNQNYYIHGLEYGATWYQNDAAGTQIRGTSTGYSDPSGRTAEQTTPRTGTFFPAPTTEFTYFYEATGLKDYYVSRVYDTAGNLTDVIDHGDLDVHDTSDTFNYHVDYQHPGTNITVASGVTARSGAVDGSGTLLAKRTVDAFFANGKPNTVSEWMVNGKDPTTGTVRTEAAPAKSTWTYTYDAYGNLQSAMSPGLTASPTCPTCGRKLQYTYDATAQTYPIMTAEVDSDVNAQYGASAVYDLRFGLPTRIIDVAGARQEIDYDNYGRVTKVFAPSDFDSSGNRINTNAPTIGVTYSEVAHTAGAVEALPAWSMATHLTSVPGEGALPGSALPVASLHTVNFVDGLVRSIQVKKDITQDDGNGNKTNGMTVSGSVAFDARGRVYQQGQPSFAAGTGNTGYVLAGMSYPTQYAYDVLGRLRQEQHADGFNTATTSISYQIGTSPTDGRSYILKLTADPLNQSNTSYHYRAEYRTVRDWVKQVSEPTRINFAYTILNTTYDYDLLGRLIKVTDAKTPSGDVTTAAYDTAGHLVLVNSPDSGQREWRYCVGGYVCAEESPNARAVSKLIKYGYDRDRLKTITYPSDTGVTYVYGNAGEKGSASGYVANRVKQRNDEAGQLTYAYDALGNVATETALLKNQKSPGTNYQSYQTQYKWDNFGRLIDVTIPGTTSLGTPTETIRYGYDAGGTVTSAWGLVGSTSYPYVRHVGYNEFGEKVRVTYGNQVFSTYSYTPDTRRLSGVNTTINNNGTPRLTQSLSYYYDLVGNILSREQHLPVDSVTSDPVKVGGEESLFFSYDPLNQLTNTSQYSQVIQSEQYLGSVDMTYDAIGNITSKNLQDYKNTYDGSGNLISQTAQADAYSFTPTYGGSRFNPSPHAASSIAMSRLGSNITQTLTYDANGNLLQNTNNGNGRYITWSDTDRVRGLCDGSTGCTPTTKALYAADGTRTHNLVIQGGTTNETIYVNQYLTVRNGTLPTKHVYIGDQRVASKVEQNSTTQTTYWYHSDHLQSTQYVTSANQALVQHLEYYPSGEIFREEKGPTLQSAVAHATTFTGKELDDASKYYYFGARYYDPQTQVWLSPDPILRQYMTSQAGAGGVHAPRNLALYTYSWNNPAVLRDPSGNNPFVMIAERVSDSPLGERAGEFLTKGIQLFGAAYAGVRMADKMRAPKPLLIKNDSEAKRGESTGIPERVIPSESSGQPTSPTIDPATVAGKTADEIAKIAADHGLVAKGKDPKAGRGSYVDPVTGEQRILVHPTPESGDPHSHVNDPQGKRLDVKGNHVEPDSEEAHLPLKIDK